MVGLVVVSHSRRLAEGVKELLDQMVKANVRVEFVGGAPLEPRLIGTDPIGVKEAIIRVMDSSGVLIIGDLGSAIISSKAAIKMLPHEIRDKVVIADAPLVEGSFAAAVEISAGGGLDDAKKAAEDAKNLRKI
jgi:dihydroxyacetone kinase phosphotransfer subunit